MTAPPKATEASHSGPVVRSRLRSTPAKNIKTIAPTPQRDGAEEDLSGVVIVRDHRIAGGVGVGGAAVGENPDRKPPRKQPASGGGEPFQAPCPHGTPLRCIAPATAV